MAALLSLALTLSISAPQMASGLGSHTRPVAASSRFARMKFNEGLAYLYAFNHREAIRSFEAATKLDPKCGMAWWGIATANGPHINNPFVSADDARAATDALRKASQGALRPVDRALVEAAKDRFRFPQSADRAALDRAYAAKMREVWRRFPNDPDVGALFAESLMDLRPWDLWQKNGKPQPGTNEVTDVLARVLKISPRHPMGLHLTIHAWEASPHPERADIAADRLRNLQPALGHMVHMPSHIDVLRGRWQKAIVSNERAIAADAAYRKRRPRQGFYRLYMAHNGHMLGFSAMMVGQREKAIAAMDRMVAEMPKEFVRENAFFMDAFNAMPIEARVRFGDWKGVLAYPAFPSFLPVSTALRHAARGVAHAALGNPSAAEEEQRQFLMARLNVPEGAPVGNSPAAGVLDVAEKILAGEILVAQGRMDEAITALRGAVRAEDALRYDEPPDWIIPTRHTLGAVLLKAGRAAEAEQVYRQDLRRLPENGWSLRGLSQALARQSREAEASRVEQRFALVWKGGDMRIGTSCLCIPRP